MESIPTELRQLSYPAIYWSPGFVGILHMSEALCTHLKGSLLNDLEILKEDKIKVLDSQGAYFKIVGYEPIPPFEGWKWRLRRMFYRLSFAKPIIEGLRHLDLAEHKKKIASAVHARFQYDLEKSDGIEIVRQLKAAKTHQEAMACVLKLWP
jgi:hypothetical protein